MSLITEELYSRMLTIPISLPQTVIGPNTSLVVAAVKLELPNMLRFRWLNLQLASNGLERPNRVNSSLGFAYAGIYAGVRDHVPTGLPLAISIASTIGVRSTNPFAKRDFSAPDTYEILVTNNTTNNSLRVVVSGCLQLFLK